MATILRSSKYLRSFSGFARRLVFNHSSSGDAAGRLLSQSQFVSSFLAKNLATRAAAHQSPIEPLLERSLQRLDQDVRRMGRISRKDIEEILEAIRTSRSATSSQALMVIRCCGNLIPEELPSARTELVKQIWRTLEELRIPMDVSHYNALLRVYLENDHAFAPIDFLKELESKGVEPNRVTYLRLITSYCQQGDIDGATKILEFMREKQLPVNENVFNALLMGHSQANDMQSAVEILSVMQQAGLEPSADTYTALLCGYAKNGDIESIKRVISECEAKDVLLLDKDFMEVVYSLASNGHSEYINDIISSMPKNANYNQDSVNMIMKLVNIGQEDIAFKILLSMPKPIRRDGLTGLVGTFFIKQMVKANLPAEKIVDFCQKLENEGHNHRAFSIAVESSLLKGDLAQSIPLLKAWQSTGAKIRHHFFWPFLVKEGKNRNNDGIVEVLNCMVNEFDLIPGGDTLREYVIPFYHGSLDEVLMVFRKIGMSPATSANCVALYMVQTGDIREAARIMSQYRAHYPVALFRRPLVAALIKTEDVKSYVTIVRNMLESLHGKENTEEQPADFAETTGILANDILHNIRDNRVSILTSVLEGFLEEGLNISSAAARKLEEGLGEALIPELTTIIGKLSSETLVPKALPAPDRLPMTYETEVARLKILITKLEKKGEPVLGLKRQLLFVYCHNKNVQCVEELLQELDPSELVRDEGFYARLIGLYCDTDQFEKAEKYMTLFKSNYPGVPLDEWKSVKYAGLLVKNNRIDDALELLDEQRQEPTTNRRAPYIIIRCRKMLDDLAELGDVENVKKLFDILVKQQYITISNSFLAPLVKVHLVRNDLKTAMDTFEWACETHRSTPQKNDLTVRLIEAEDAASLQRLTDLSSQVHGEVNSLYDLVLAFVECKRFRQAKKILETPGLQSRSHKLVLAADRFREAGQITHLEGLIEVIKDVSLVKREELFHSLLLAYSKNGEWEKGLGLWTTMQEVDVQPSDEFLTTLAELLRNNNQRVPFAESKLPVEDAALQEPQKTNTMKSAHQTATQEVKDSFRKELLIQSQQIDNLLRNNQVSEAVKIATNMLKAGMFPLTRFFHRLLNQLVKDGDLQSLANLGNEMSSELKRIFFYESKVLRANMNAGLLEDYLNRLEKGIENAKDEDLPKIARKFPHGAAIGIMEEHPEHIQKFMTVAEKYAARGIVGPMNVIWMDYFIKSKPEAERIWSEHMSNAPKVMFKRIIKHAKETSDANLLERLIEKLDNASDVEKGYIYNTLMDIHNQQGQFDESLSVLEKAMKKVSLERIDRTTLLSLQKGVESMGKSFPYTIPAEDRKHDSSSSSDDDSVKQLAKQ